MSRALKLAWVCGTLAVLLCVAGPARAGGSALDPLLDALEARVGAIAAEPKPSGFEKKEGKSLAQALALLAEWEGGTGTKDLALLSKAAAGVTKSKTFDIPVLASIHTLRDVIDHEAESARQDATKILVLLVDPALQLKLDKKLAKADATRAAAHLAWPGNFGSAARVLTKAVAQFRDVLAQAQKGQTKEAKKTPNDAHVVEAFIVTPAPQIGHPVDVTTVTSVQQPTAKLTVVVRIVLKSEVDAASDPEQDPGTIMKQCVLGEYTLTDLPAGEHSATHSFDVPKEYLDPITELPVPLFEDQYYLMVELDVHDELIELLGETGEANNVFIDTKTPYLFSDDFIDAPNIALESVELNPKIVFAETTGLPAANFGVAMTVSTSGHDEPITGMRVTTTLSAQVTVEGKPLDLLLVGQIWDDVEEAYVSSLFLPPLQPGQPLVIHLDIRYEPPMALGPVGLGLDPDDYAAALSFTVAKVGLVQYEPYGDDDTAVVPDCTFSVVPVSECSTSASFDKTAGNSNFAATVSFDAALDVTADSSLFPPGKATAGALGTVNGGVDVKLMGLDVEFTSFEALLERDPVQDYSYFKADLYFLKKVIYSTGNLDSPMLAAFGPILPEGVSFCDGGFCYEKDFDKSKAITKNGYFFPGGVPVTVTGKIEGKIGFEVGVKAADALTLSGGPFVELLAGCDLALGVCPAACVGAGGELTLVKDTFVTTAGAGMTVLEGTDGLGDPAKSIDTALCFSVVNKIEMLNGKLFVFASFPWCDTCWAFLAPYPCNCGFKKVTLDIIKWKPFTFCQTLVSKVFPLCCTPINGLGICTGSSSTVCIPSGCPGGGEGD